MISAASIIAGLGGNPTTGMCRCPVPGHEDATPSLHVSDGRKGPVWRCHVTCSQQEVTDALRARGLLAAPRADSRRTRPENKADDSSSEFDRLRRAWTILRAAMLAGEQPAAYLRGRGVKIVPRAAMLLPASKTKIYTGKNYPAMVLPIANSEHHLVGAHVTWLSRDAASKLAVGDGRPRRMFGVCKGGYAQLSEIDPAGPLIIGEGPESTLSAMAIADLPGIAALSAGNLAALRPPAASEYIIAADNDDAGRGAAAALAERLEYEGKKVRIALPRPEGMDWNDRLLRAKAPDEEWREAMTAESHPEPVPKHHSLEDFMALTFPKREMLLAPWLPQPGLAMIFARAGHGKTYLALSIAFAVARGEDFLGWRCERPGRVLYIDGEMPGSYLQKRLDCYGRPPRGTLHIVCRDTFNLRRQAMPDLGTTEGRRAIDGIIKEVQPDLVILDSLSTLVRTGEENSPEDWLPVQDWLMGHRWRGRTTLMIHHAGKSGTQRGTSKREDTPETTIQLVKRPRDTGDADDESIFEMSFAKGREVFGGDEEPMVLRMAIRDGRVQWRHEAVRDVRRDRVRELIDAGMKNKEIAREIGVTPGRVSQIVKELKREGNVIKFPSTDKHDHDKRDET
jgi:putative DNA primase/helicase